MFCGNGGIHAEPGGELGDTGVTPLLYCASSPSQPAAEACLQGVAGGFYQCGLLSLKFSWGTFVATAHSLDCG